MKSIEDLQIAAYEYSCTTDKPVWKESFIDGAKWAMAHMYSFEDVVKICQNINDMDAHDMEEKDISELIPKKNNI